MNRQALSKARSQAVDSATIVAGEVTAIQNYLRGAQLGTEISAQTVQEFLDQLTKLLEQDYPDQAARVRELESDLENRGAGQQPEQGE